MPFTLLDGILLLVVLISAVLAMIRGFTREVFSIASWVAAAAAAYFLWDKVLPYVQRYIDDKNLALGITVAGIFFVTLLIVSIITMRISDFVLDSRAGPLDRTLGFAFGAARGVVLVIIAVLFINFFIAPEKQPEWIAMAKSKPWLDSLGQDLMNRLPEDPEAEIMQRLRGETGRQPTPAAGGDDTTGGDDVVPEPTPDTDTGVDSDSTPPADDDPGIAPDDQNQLDRELNAPPPD
jgi:membrane protein required for colicin V production